MCICSEGVGLLESCRQPEHIKKLTSVTDGQITTVRLMTENHDKVTLRQATCKFILLLNY